MLLVESRDWARYIRDGNLCELAMNNALVRYRWQLFDVMALRPYRSLHGTVLGPISLSPFRRHWRRTRDNISPCLRATFALGPKIPQHERHCGCSRFLTKVKRGPQSLWIVAKNINCKWNVAVCPSSLAHPSIPVFVFTTPVDVSIRSIAKQTNKQTHN